MTPVVHLELWISLRIFEKIQNGLNGMLRGLGETDSWNKQKSKISWHCPFKDTDVERISDLKYGNLKTRL